MRSTLHLLPSEGNKCKVGAILPGVGVAAITPRALRALPKRPNWRGVELPYPAGLIAAVAGL